MLWLPRPEFSASITLVTSLCIRSIVVTQTHFRFFSKGNIGILDISTRSYKTLMRSHTEQILSCSFDPSRRCLATVSDDETIRIWDLDTLCQLYDFRAASEKPCAVTYHPHQQLFACGFRNGAVRVFNIGKEFQDNLLNFPTQSSYSRYI